MKISALSVAALVGMAVGANAAGFRLSMQDSRAAGMGNAVVAADDNASASWYNPAAITSLEGTNLELGSVMEAPAMKHKNTDGRTDKIDSVLHVPPHFYATRKLGGNWALGLGVNVPFGLSTNWDKTSAETRTAATKSQIQAVYSNLNAAYSITDKMSLALGLAWVNLTAEMDKKIEVAGNNIEQKLTGDGTGVGYNAAAIYKPSDKLQFGASFRSSVKINVDGKIKLPTTGFLASLAADGPAKTKITLPDLFQAGVAYKYGDKWLFSADADYTDWTTYRKLVIDYTTTAGVASQSIDYKNWKSVWAFRAGTEYKYSDAWKIRGGIFYDANPVRDLNFETRVPDSNRVGFSAGAGYKKGSLTVDASLMFVTFLEREITKSYGSGTTVNPTLNGKYNAYAVLPALTLGYKF